MSKVISKVFVVFGAIVMLSSLAVFCLNFTYGFVVLVLGAAVLFLGLSMNRLERIEDKLGKYILAPKDIQKPLVKCEKCDRIYEMEYGQCPYCEAERVKKDFIR